MSEYDVTMTQNNQIMNTFIIDAAATYCPVVRDQFYALVPDNLKYYYVNAVRRCIQWFEGYVPEVHKAGAGIFSTGIGTTIVREAVKLTLGGEVYFANKYGERKGTEQKNPALMEFNKWSDRIGFQNLIRKYVTYSAAGGVSVLLAYMDNNSDLNFRPLRLDQMFFKTDVSGRIIDITAYLACYSPKTPQGVGRKDLERDFYVVERRYYNEKGEPCMKYAVHEQTGNVATGQSFDFSTTTERQWEQLPNGVKAYLKRDFPGIKFGIENRIYFADGDIAVYPLHWTVENRIPELKMGESILLPVLGYMLEFEISESHFVTDMYISKGKVLVPAPMMNPTDEKYQGYYSGFDNLVFTKNPMQNLDDQKPMAIQFEMRSDEHSRNRNNISEKIAATVGYSGSDLFSYLRDSVGGSKTATQIAAEDKKTKATISEKRSLIKSAFEPIMKLWKSVYKQSDDITMRFSDEATANKMVNIDQMRMLKEIGLSNYDLYKIEFPDYDDAQIEEMVNRHYEELKRVAEMNAKVQIDAMMRSANNTPIGKGVQEKEEKPPIEETAPTKETKESGEGQNVDLEK